jgi:LacI family transcriptional regulator
LNVTGCTMSQLEGNITMAEIARRCRLSKATVSRALSMPEDQCPVNAETRDKIIRLAKGMGYRPNWRARVFSRQKTHTVGLILSGLLPQHEAIPHQILEAFTRVLRESVDACATINDPADEVVKEVSQSRLPAVAMNASPKIPLPVVTVDDIQGGAQVGRYLRDLGHRRVAMYVNEDALPHYSQEARLRGLAAGLERSDDKAGETSVQFVRDSDDRAMSAMLDQEELPTAIVCYSHYEVMPVLKELWQRKIPVPQRMSVIGFNDVFPMDCTIPSMTMVSVPADKIGNYAATLLLKQINEGAQGEASVRIFPENLVVRQSCTAPSSEPAAR